MQVLIDHGLCIELSEKFRYDYSLLWRSLFVGDVATIERIGTSWGIAANNSDMLASVRFRSTSSLMSRADFDSAR